MYSKAENSKEQFIRSAIKANIFIVNTVCGPLKNTRQICSCNIHP